MRKQFFEIISEENKFSSFYNADEDFIFFSTLKEGYTENPFRHFSIKFAASGHIHYKIGKQSFKVQGNNFLLAARQLTGFGYIDSTDHTKSICIDISAATINEVFTILSEKSSYDFDNYLSSYFSYPDFPDRLCNTGQTIFSSKLLELKEFFLRKDLSSIAETVNEEWFFGLAEKIVMQEYEICSALNGIHSVKTVTRKETLRRLNEGKDFIAACFLKNPAIAEVAKICGMSEFHFFRAFKQAYGLSPYQYILRMRLAHSLQLLQKNKDDLSTISRECGFGDLPTFLKAFKRTYGMSPTTARNAQPTEIYAKE